MGMKKGLLWVALAAVIAAGGFLVLGNREKAEPKYRTAIADRGTVTRTVTATGTLSAVTTVKVGSQVSGIIAALHADFNSRVHRGDLIAELDPTPFQAKVAQNEANLEKANVDLRNAGIALRRQTALKDQGLAPEADFDQAQANYDSAAAAVAQQEAALKQARTDLGYTKITAPIDGVVVDRQYDVGQTVAASFQAPTLFTIAQDLTKMQVSTDVSESDIGQCRVDQPVRFTVDAYPDQEFRGRISQIRLNATVNQNVVTYPVIVEVANPDLTLRPNMTANVTIDVATMKNVLRIPNGALRWRPEAKAPGPSAEEGAARFGGSGPAGAARQFGATAGKGRTGQGGQVVYTIAADGKGEPKPVDIRAGITDGRFTQVVSGDLKEGDTVIVGLATAKADASRAPGMGGRRF
jgi:HlyD family secretion protein